MYAILQVLVVGIAPLDIYTDYLPFIDGLARGKLRIEEPNYQCS